METRGNEASQGCTARQQLSLFLHQQLRKIAVETPYRYIVQRLRGATLCAGHFGKDQSNLKVATNQSRLQTIENCEQFVPATENPGKG